MPVDEDSREWFSLWPAGSTQHRWFVPECDGPMDDATWQHLCRWGLAGAPQHVWMQEQRSHGGKVWCDMLWDSSGSGVKVVSSRLSALLRDLEPRLVESPAEVRDRDGTRVPEYVSLAEPFDRSAPVHSYGARERFTAFVIDADVRRRVLDARLVGLDITAESTPFPGDEPLEEF